MNTFVEPALERDSFTCPHCGAFAQQKWTENLKASPRTKLTGLKLSFCAACQKHVIWEGRKIVNPVYGSTPPPVSDMPEGITVLYDEARSVFENSPRSASALLRMCIQELCIYLGEKGINFREDFRHLIARGLPEDTMEVLKKVHIIGENAVIPGTIKSGDTKSTASDLFNLTNLIVLTLISNVDAIEALKDTGRDSYAAKKTDKGERGMETVIV